MDVLEVLKVLSPYVALLATGIFAVLGWFARDLIVQMRQETTAHRETMAANERKVDALRIEFLEMQAQLPRDFVLKDDHIRHMTLLERKIDELREDIRETLTTIQRNISILLRETPKRRSDEG